MRYGSRRGWGVFVGCLALVVMSACSDGGGEEASEDGRDSGGAELSVSGVEPEVTNAVAPFDHPSAADSQRLAILLNQRVVEALNECLVREGISPIPLSDIPDRDDPMLWANVSFPNIEGLARSGFPTLPGTPSSPSDFEEPSETDAQVEQECADETDAGNPGLRSALELYASLRGGWESELQEIDATDEIAGLTEEFSACLQQNGIPATEATDENAFMNHVDASLMGADDDAAEMASIRERYGQLYVECGRDLFEARERLRGGDRRRDFLAENEAAIVELSDAVFGSSSESSDS